MRLTLRTLLAYLDDVLEPSQAKLMGQKIQESPVAGVLVSRIREVMRRRRLSAPDVQGPHVGIDPNIVAQYLDNTLPPDQVADVERVLLSSDELLAEVAACHQVLTLVIGEPGEVSAPVRERLYALGPVAAADRLHIEASPASTKEPVDSLASVGQEPGQANSGETDASKSDTSHVVPDYLKSKNQMSQRLVPAAIVALMALICVGLLASDPGFVTGLSQAKKELAKVKGNSQATSKGDVKIAERSQVDGSSSNTGVVGEAMAPSAEPQPQTSPATPELSKTPIDASINPDKVATKPATPQPASATAPVEGVASPKPKPATPVVPPPVATLPPAPKPAAIPLVQPQYTSTDGVVLRYQTDDQHWYQQPRQSAVKVSESLACLEPFEATLNFDPVGIRATILGDSLIRVMEPNDATSTGIDIRRGRVLIEGSKTDEKQTKSLSIAVSGDVWTLELQTPQTVCAVEILPRGPVGYEKFHEANGYVGTLYVLAGSAKWTSRDGSVQEIKDRSGFPITPEGPGTTTKSVPVSFPAPPEWTDAQKRKSSPFHRYAAVFEKKFSLDVQGEEVLQVLVTDDNASIAALAVRGLALTDSIHGLAQALSVCKNEEGRFAAREGLHLWLPTAADNGTQLKRELETLFPPADAETVYRLLWGFDRDDGKDKIQSMQLVGLLRSPNQTVRELALHWVSELTKPRRWEYRPTEISPMKRELHIRRIESLIDKDGALIKPE